MDRLIDLNAERQRKAQQLEENFAAFRQEVERNKIASEHITEAVTKLIDTDFSLPEIKALLLRAAKELDDLAEGK